MAGDPANAAVWAFADVYVGATNAPNPANAETEFGAEWDLVGLLDGEPGFAYARQEEATDHYAWGGVLVRTSRRNFKQTVAFTALEDNPTTRELIWPNSTPTQLIVPKPKRIKIAFEVREEVDGGTKIKRLISHYQAEVALNGDQVDNEGSLANAPLIATIFPDDQGVLFDRQETNPASS